MERRIHIELKEDLHKKLLQRSKQAGCTMSNLVRAWLCTCEEIDQLNIKRQVKQPEKFISYNIILEDSLVNTIDGIAKEMGITRNLLISNILESNLDSKGLTEQIINLDLELNFEAYKDLSLEKIISKILNSNPFIIGHISGGIALRDGNIIQVKGVTSRYLQRLVTKILPVPLHLIKFDMRKHDNMHTKAIKSNTMQIDTHLRNLLNPLLVPSVWNKMQKFVGVKLIAVFPLEYNDYVFGVLVTGFHSAKLDLRTMGILEKYTKEISKILGEKIYCAK